MNRGRTAPPRSRRLVTALVLALAAAGIPAAALGGQAACRTSGPGNGVTVEVCITSPESEVTVSGAVPVQVTVDVSDGANVEQIRAFLGGQAIIIDQVAPYRFVLPTDRYPDGSNELGVSADVDTSGSFTSARARVSLTFDNGNAGDPGPSVTFEEPSVPPTGEPVVLAAVGDGAGSQTAAPAVLSLIESWDPDAFLYLGDVYATGTHAEFASWYGPPGKNFARLHDITAPTPGNHEYLSNDGEPYFEYWGVEPFYAFDAGDWRVISLDANKDFHGHEVGSAQYEWLRDELTTTRRACTLAFWHQPRFTVGKYTPGADWMQPIWQLLAEHGVDVTLHGHDHGYQRWRPIGPSGALDADGIRQFISGTGGHPTYAFRRTDARMAFGLEHTRGALRFELGATGADWSWRRTDGTVADSGSFACSPVPDEEPPSSPADLTATASGPRSVLLDWTASTDDVGVTGYRIYRDGEQIDEVPTWPTAATDAGLESETTYAYRVRALDAAGNLSRSSDRVSVTTPTDDAPPSIPGGLRVSVADRFHAELAWNEATDDIGVVGYDIARNGILLGTGAASSFADETVVPGETYLYTVRARDTAGHTSAFGAPLEVSIPAALFADGFESGGLATWTSTTGGVVVDGGGSRGTRAVRFDVNGAARGYAYRDLSAPEPDLVTEATFRLLDHGSNAVDLLALRAASGGATGATLFVTQAGYLALTEQANGSQTVSRRLVDDGNAHVLRVRARVDGTVKKLVTRLDGVKVGALSGKKALGPSAIGRIRIGDGTIGRAYDMIVDEVAAWRG
ncbi:MAG: Ig-like domain-containing protein [Actinomycetota bacterium]